MNEQVKLKWTDALRSGRYKKYKGGWRRELVRQKGEKEIKYEHCVLAVLIDLHAIEHNESYYHSYHSQQSVAEWAGLSELASNPLNMTLTNKCKNETRTIIQWNDSTDMTFKEMAEAIENQL